MADHDVERVADLYPEQPPPVPRPGVRSVQAAVRDDLAVREQVGIARYGTSLQPHNGRDAHRDLYEELLDACCYAKQLLVERDEAGGLGEQGSTSSPVSMAAPFEALVRIDRFGIHRSWRCKLGCPYDQRADDEAAAIRAALNHLATEHGIYPTGGRA